MDRRNVGRPAVIASDLYGRVKDHRIDEYIEETTKRWTYGEMAILAMWAENNTVSQLVAMLPNRNDQQVRRMLEYLSS